jgi:hypothetical protein
MCRAASGELRCEGLRTGPAGAVRVEQRAAAGADATHFGGWRLSGDILDAPEKLVVPSGNPAGLIVVPDQAVLPNLPALDQVMKMIDIADVLLGHLSSSG